MRVARFAARFGYSVDGHTFEGMKQSLETLKKVSKERINDELTKILMSENPSFGLQLLQGSGALDIACPLLAGRQLPLLPFQDQVGGPLQVRLGFLYNKLPIEQVKEELINLKFSNAELKRTVFLLELVERFYRFQEQDTAQSYKSFMAFLKNHSLDTWHQTLAQFLQLVEPMGIEAWTMLDKYRQEVVLTRKEMQLNGDDLLAAGMPAGPRIKKALDECYLEVLRHPEHNTKDRLLEVARQY